MPNSNIAESHPSALPTKSCGRFATHQRDVPERERAGFGDGIGIVLLH
jgi:hypothetical protein